MREKPETSISLDNPFLHSPALRVASRVSAILLPSDSVSRFAIYHRSINLCRDSISTQTPSSSCLASTTVLSPSSDDVPPGWILSQTQSGAPLRAKSEDMIVRECLVFYKIGYPSWEIEMRENDRTFARNWIAPLGDRFYLIRFSVRTFKKYRVIYSNTATRKHRSNFYKHNSRKRYSAMHGRVSGNTHSSTHQTSIFVKCGMQLARARTRA